MKLCDCLLEMEIRVSMYLYMYMYMYNTRWETDKIYTMRFIRIPLFFFPGGVTTYIIMKYPKLSLQPYAPMIEMVYIQILS